MCHLVSNKVLKVVAESVARAHFGARSAGSLGFCWRPVRADEEDGGPRVRVGAHWRLRDAAPVAAVADAAAPAKGTDAEKWFYSDAALFVSPLVCNVDGAALPKAGDELQRTLRRAGGVLLLLETPAGFNVGATGTDGELVRALLAPLVTE